MKSVAIFSLLFAGTIAFFLVRRKKAEANRQPVHTVSFLGVYFEDRTVTKVLVRHDGKLAGGGKDVSQGGSKDLIVLDDLVYSEPWKQ